MKQVIVIAALVALVSCAEYIEGDSKSELTEYTVVASHEPDLPVKTVIDDASGNISWMAGDAINV